MNKRIPKPTNSVSLYYYGVLVNGDIGLFLVIQNRPFIFLLLL